MIEMLTPWALVEPDEAVVAETVTIELPTGVPRNEALVVPFPEPPELQPPPYAMMSEIHRSSIRVTANPLRLPTFLRSTPGNRSTATANTPPWVQGQFNGSKCRACIEGAIVVTVRVVVAGPPFGVTEAGVNEQLATAGSPVQANATASLKPLVGVTINVNVADLPCLMVAEVGNASTL